MHRKRQRKAGLLLVILSRISLGSFGFAYNQNRQSAFPDHRVKRPSHPIGGISRAPLGEARPKRKQWNLLAEPISCGPSSFQALSDFNDNVVPFGLDIEAFALSGRIAKVSLINASSSTIINSAVP